MKQELIKQIEKEITEIQESIDYWKQTIINHESKLLALQKELTTIKKDMKNENNKSPRGLNKNN